MAFHDRELRVRRTNAAFRRLVGLPDEALIGRRPSEFDTGVDAALIERTLAEQVMARAFPWSTCPWGRSCQAGTGSSRGRRTG